MKFLKFFESHQTPSLEDIKRLEHILTDEIGTRVLYSTDSHPKYKEGNLKIYVMVPVSNFIIDPTEYKTIEEKNKLYHKKLKEKFLDTEFFEEYIDRLKDFFNGTKYGSISIFVNGNIYSVINWHGYYPISD